jgi:hypothetical protein
MASIIAESSVGARSTVRADACSVDRIHPKNKTIYRYGHPSPDCVGPVEEGSALMVASEFKCVEVFGIGALI